MTITTQQMHAIATHTTSVDQKSSLAMVAVVMVGFGVLPSMCVLVGEVVSSLMLLRIEVTAPLKPCFVNTSFTAVTDTTDLLFAGMENAISTTTLIPAGTNKRLSATVEAVVAVTAVIRMVFVMTLYAIASDCTNTFLLS